MEDFPRLVLLIIGAVLTYPMFMQGVNSRTSNTKICPSDEVSTLRKTLFALGDQSVDVTVGTQTELYQEYSLQDDCSRPRECGEVRCCGKTRSGIYKVFPFGVGKGRYVFCDFQTDDNAWTVIQRRQDGSVDFDRNWDEYEKGFGQLDGEFWLGLSTIHELLSQFRFELLITMRNFSGGEAWAKYNWVYVSGPGEKYRLQIGSYSGTAGDALRSRQNGRMFTTRDNDNDESGNKNCAEAFKGPGWFGACYHAHLNGPYCSVTTQDIADTTCVNWYHWNSAHKPLQYVDVKVRPVNSKPGCPLSKPL